jgi:hypothetical protein
MRSFLLMLLASMAFSWMPGVSLGEEDLSGAWEGSKLGYRLVANVSHRGEDLQGVAYVIAPFGGRNPYHFKGTLRNGEVMLAHHEGNVFRGRLLSRDAVAGVVETRTGERFSVEIRRSAP